MYCAQCCPSMHCAIQCTKLSAAVNAVQSTLKIVMPTACRRAMHISIKCTAKCSQQGSIHSRLYIEHGESQLLAGQCVNYTERASRLTVYRSECSPSVQNAFLYSVQCIALQCIALQCSQHAGESVQSLGRQWMVPCAEGFKPPQSLANLDPSTWLAG